MEYWFWVSLNDNACRPIKVGLLRNRDFVGSQGTPLCVLGIAQALRIISGASYWRIGRWSGPAQILPKNLTRNGLVLYFHCNHIYYAPACDNIQSSPTQGLN